MRGKKKIIEYLAGLSAVNTHSHHLSDGEFAEFSLRDLLEKSYCSWMDAPPDDMAQADAYIRRNACNSYFLWLFRAIDGLYGLPVVPENFDPIDGRIRTAYQNPGWHMDILKNKCGYEKVLLDYYPQPGSDLGHPELFVPVLRCNMFAVCNTPEAEDHNGNNPFRFFGRQFADMDEYIDAIEQQVGKYRAVKFALAYDTDNDIFRLDGEDAARRAFNNPDASAEDCRAYHDHMVYRICRAAARTGAVVQFHTGLGNLEKSSPMWLRPLIEACPDVKFDLFHGGYPWMDDTLALAHNYKNVWVDICWLPLISTSAAVRFLREALEVTDAHRILWGCDTWTSEESYGAVLAGREAIAGALAAMMGDGAISEDYAHYIARRIWRENAKELYGI